MGCATGKPTMQQSFSSIKCQTHIVSEILKVVEGLERLNYERIANHEDIPQEYLQLPLDQFLVKAYQCNFYSKEELQQLYNESSMLFNHAKCLLLQVEQLLNEADKFQRKIKPNIRSVFEQFQGLFYQLTKDMLSMPIVDFDQLRNYSVQKEMFTIMSETMLEL